MKKQINLKPADDDSRHRINFHNPNIWVSQMDGFNKRPKADNAFVISLVLLILGSVLTVVKIFLNA